MKRLLSTLTLLFRGTPRAPAQGFEKAKIAYDRADYAAALAELRPLAGQGDPLAQTLLGFMYNSGEGVPRDHAEAFRLYTMAAEAGYASAQYNLGVMLGDGEGVPQDDVQSLTWLCIAEAQGNAAAANEVETVVGLLPADQVEDARQRAQAWMDQHGM